MASCNKALLPGSKFPEIKVKTVNNGPEVSLSPDGKSSKLVVFYRGAFCPFCNGHVDYLKEQHPKLAAEGIDVVVASADSQEVAQGMWDKREGLPFTFAYGLTEEQLKSACVFISNPRHYQPQTQKFSEPAWFLLKPDGTIKYMDLATAPMGGRVNVDHLVAASNWSKQNAIEHPEFANVVWGSVPNHDV